MLVSTQLIVLRLLPFSTTVGGGRNFTAPGGTFLCGREISSFFLPGFDVWRVILKMSSSEKPTNCFDIFP
uniref:Putative secreted peptide n=1 Tax=Anopheles braziliensis TaxID=58242 RepID=A0A2M3ZVZ9_9DIPT